MSAPTSSHQTGSATSSSMPTASQPSSSPEEHVIGIVIGNTNISVGFCRLNRIEIIANERGERLTPACVAFTDERCLKGQDAVDQQYRNHINTISGINRLIGRKYEEIADDLTQFDFKVINNNNIPMICVEWKNKTSEFTAEGILGLLLSRVKETADSFLPTKATRAVICYQVNQDRGQDEEQEPSSLIGKMKNLAVSFMSTAADKRPADEVDPQVRAVKAAAGLENIHAVDFIDKVSAAILAYRLDRDLTAKNVVIFHCGGATTFAAVLTRDYESGTLVTKSLVQRNIGGHQFDDRMVTLIRKMFQEKFHYVIPDKEMEVIHNIRTKILAVKIQLSNITNAKINLPKLYREKDFKCDLVRSQLEDTCTEMFTSVTDVIDEAIGKSDVRKEDMTDVILIGGSCKIPKIEELVRAKFPASVRALKSDDAQVPADMIPVYGTCVQTAIIRKDAQVPKLNFKLIKPKEAGKPPAIQPRASTRRPKQPATSSAPEGIVRNPVQQVAPVPPARKVEDRRQGQAAAPIPEPVLAEEAMEEPNDEPDSGIVIGIDLGTTYSCVGIYKNDSVHIIPDADDRKVIPSCVAFTDTHRLIGYAAKKWATQDPENVVFDAKRLIGRKYSDKTVQEDKKHWPFTIVNDNNKPKIEVTFMGKKEQFHAEDISGFVLSKLRDMAQEYTGQRITKCVITVPANFNDFQRQATKTAAQIAGLQVLKIINEPTAAAIAYGLDYTKDGRRTVLVYDLGGGTFDVSIMQINGKELEVKATSGDTHLGGEDFDNRLVLHFLAKFMERHHMDISINKQAIRRLRVACERAKIRLSECEETNLELVKLGRSFGKVDYTDGITRAEFEEICQDLFDRTITLLEKVLRDAKISKNDIDDVVLVGGSTRIPKIQQMVRSFFNNKDLKRDINPDEAVAVGAVMHAAMMEEDYAIALAPVIRDVTPLSLGIGISGEVMQKIIPRNTRIPCSISETFFTDGDDQEYAYFDVLQGERTSVKDNVRLGEMIISGIPKAKRSQAPIEVVFEMDHNGVLIAKAKTSPGAAYQVIKVTDPCDIPDEEVQRMVRKAEEMRQSDRQELDRIQVRNELHAHCYDHRNDARIGILCQEILIWMQKNPDASRRALMDKMERVK